MNGQLAQQRVVVNAATHVPQCVHVEVSFFEQRCGQAMQAEELGERGQLVVQNVFRLQAYARVQFEQFVPWGT
jgi:hypothetical protein